MQTSNRTQFERLIAATLALVSLLATAAVCAAATSDDIDRQASELANEYRRELGLLADWCDQQGLTTEAAKTRAWFVARPEGRIYVPVLPKRVGSLDPPPGVSAPMAEWHARWKTLREEKAEAMYQLARQAVRGRRASLALDLVNVALRENPDHEAVRRMFGFRKHEDRWCTSFEAQNLKLGKIEHDKYGWLPASYVARYELGERYHRGHWISAEADALVHRDIRNGWIVQTEHYTVKTNHSIAAGVALGRKLEMLHYVWRQLFVSYFATEAQVAAMFNSRGAPRSFSLPEHTVVFFRDRDNYNQWLRRQFPNIEISDGVYANDDRSAYFFAGADDDDRTLIHEATHQLFSESRRAAPDAGLAANFWIVEGIAMYMESLRLEDGFYVLGGFEDERMKAARYRLLVDEFYVPLAELCTYGRDRIQADRRIATLYSQAAGLTHFLVHYERGRYRDAVIEYLAAVYNSRADASTLAGLAGASYDELDAQYRRFMEAAEAIAGDAK